MKKLLMTIFAVLAAVMVSAPFSGVAEAAFRVAVVPVQVDAKAVERHTDFNSYYWDILVDKFKFPEYELVDDDQVLEVVPADGLKVFDLATLKDIAEKTDAEIVVAMRIDKVTERPQNSRREPTLECFMQGQFASYNKVTDKFYNKKIYHKNEIEEVLTIRNDWQQEVFADYLRRGIYRTVEIKNKKK